MDLEHVKRVGIAAAYKGQSVLLSHYGKVKVIKKGAIDLITKADTGSEKRIIETIKKAFPDHPILSEESGLNKSKTDHKKIFDPFDGTTKFSHPLGLFSFFMPYPLALTMKAFPHERNCWLQEFLFCKY